MRCKLNLWVKLYLFLIKITFQLKVNIDELKKEKKNLESQVEKQNRFFENKTKHEGDILNENRKLLKHVSLY